MRSTAPGPEPRAALATALALALAIPGGATAGAVPDPAQLAAMRGAIARAPVLLVKGDFGVREIRHAWLDSAGVSARPAAPPIIAWSEIATLETQRPKKLQGATAGFVIGLAAGATLAGLHEESYTGDYTRLGYLLGTPAVGVLAGTILGSFSGTKVIYRAPTQENH